MGEEENNHVRSEMLDLAAGQAILGGKGVNGFTNLAMDKIEDAERAIKIGDPEGVASQHVQLASAYSTLALAASNQALLFERLASSTVNLGF